MDAAHFVVLNSGDRTRFDPIPLTAGDDEYFGFVIEAARADEQLRNQLSIYHAKPALGVRDFLPASTADPIAHVTIHHASDKWHRREVVHAITEEQAAIRCQGRCSDKTLDFFRKMLAISVENDHVNKLSIQPVP